MGWLRSKKKNKKPTESEILANKRGTKLLEELIECYDGKSNPIKFFSTDEILNATNSFSGSNRLSELDGYGCYHWTDWYSGKNENHPRILVKKLYRYADGTFIRDIAVSSMVSGHNNFMKLVGCCLQSKNPVMVYDGVKKHYQIDIRRETWKRRMKIAEDIATALAYLHTAFPRPFVYRSICRENILVDEDGVAKLTDFSYCVSIPQGETFVQVEKVAGINGYMDDKYMRNRLVSEETDIFAIGILMLKFLTGKEILWIYDDDEEVEAEDEGYDDDNNSYHSAAMSDINDLRRQFSEETESEEEGEAVGEEDNHDDSGTMLRPANPSFFKQFKFIEERRMDEVTDQEMLEKMGEISEEELSQMEAFKMLSLRCVGHKGEIPTMVEVTNELKKIQNISSSPIGETTQFNSPQDVSSSS
ncbi:inactive serine/threonine-protein kinase At1g67470 [Capsella rubella]|nr:inactive serine/threonine-protein kinase At1g67470 [Capsella rubella]